MRFEIIKIDHTRALELAALSQQSFEEAYAELNSASDMELFMTHQFNTDKLVAELDLADTEFYGAIDSHGKLKGYLKLTILNKFGRRGDVIEISRIYILKEVYGTGLGNILMQKAHDVAVSHQSNQIILYVWQKNPKAISFYKKWGFEITGLDTFLLGTDVQDDYVMTKKITS